MYISVVQRSSLLRHKV